MQAIVRGNRRRGQSPWSPCSAWPNVGGGVSQDFPLAHPWASGRTVRFADGPDEVHKRSLARREIRNATSSGTQE